VGVHGYQLSGATVGILVFDDDGFTEIVFEHRLYHAIVHRRNSGVFIDSAHPARVVLIQAQIDTFVGKIPPAPIAPPFIGRIEQHAVTEDPTFESTLTEFIGFDQHFGETAFPQVRI
jgi:hypothetical protein